MPRPFAPHIVETTLLTRWQGPLAMAALTPWRAWKAMVGGDALQRGANACYAQLRTLPRRVRRALQRKFALPLTGVAVLLALGQEPSQAATTWTVCASGCAYTTIQAAINAATTAAGDIITVRDAVHTEAGITVTKDLSIVGQGAKYTMVQAAATPGTAHDRVFTIASGVAVTLQALTIRYGHTDGSGGGLRNQGTLTLINSSISGNIAKWSGGGLFNDYGGTLAILINSTISGNTTDSLAFPSFGGGLNNYGTLTLTNSTISGNASNYGGGLANWGPLTLTTSTVSGNTAYGEGGGLWNNNAGTLTLTASSVSGNTATYHGGGLANTGTLTLTASTVSGNTATYHGGGLANFYGTLTLTNSTVSNNTATSGGGLFNYEGKLTLTTLTHSLVAQNPDGGDCRNTSSSIISQGYNLDSDGSCQLTAPTDRPGADLLLGPLQNNGGPTFTQALLPGSPAIDAIPWGTNGCGTAFISDQRLRARPEALKGACDIGAYEVQVAGQALGGWVTGFTPHIVTCKNVTTGQVVTLSDQATAWNCEAAGLAVSPGDHISLLARGPVDKGAEDVGGAVAGMTPSSGDCTNLTTGQQVTFQHMVGATAASCVAAGLGIHPGDQVQMSVQGATE